MAIPLGRAVAIAGGAIAMTARGAAIAAHVQRVSPRRFPQLIGRVQLALACLRDVVRGRYRMPWKIVAALTAALAYFIAPIDALPDLVPLSGFIDDAAVLALVFGAAESELRRYCEWRGLDCDAYFETAAPAR
jgi:uncharacterized membrane protein YkvA (DUF1232 family)